MIKILDADIDLCSINEKFVNRQYATSSKYKQFKNDIAKQCKRIPMIGNNVNVIIHMSCYKDIDAPLKPIFDALESCGVIKNDRYITRLEVVKTPIKRGHKERLTIWVC